MSHKALRPWIAWPPSFEAPTSHTAARGDPILVRYSSCGGDHLDLCPDRFSRGLTLCVAMAPRNACVGPAFARVVWMACRNIAPMVPRTGCRLQFSGCLDRLKESQNLNGLDFAAYCVIANGDERLEMLRGAPGRHITSRS